jgi:energy-coupling factor transport system permease protein
MENQSSSFAQKRGLWAWSTRDILIMAVMSIIFGLFLTGATYLYYVIAALGPIVYWAWNGPWLIPAVFVVYVSRRPGSGVLTTLIASLVMIPFTPYGVAALFSGLLFGVLTELSLLLFTRYRFFGWIRLALTGILTGALLLAITGAAFGAFVLAPGIIVAIVFSTTLGCALCALLARALADAVARTGVFAGTMLAASKSAQGEEEE